MTIPYQYLDNDTIPFNGPSAQHLGKGLMRFTGVGDELHLPYALEFGIVVSEVKSL